jgi:zona occludens toxin
LPASVGWCVAGQYAVDDRGYVLLADAAGHFRSEPGDNFRGEALRVEGVIDG